MKNNSFAHGQELPLGLSMALAQVPAAYAYFAKLDPLQRQQIIDSAHCIRSKEEMRGLVNSLSNGQITDTSKALYAVMEKISKKAFADSFAPLYCLVILCSIFCMYSGEMYD